ncbi:hypothetical protein [Acinetobacter entericus]|uniref:Uncharacterized protein n=1 Tax=Acinetobacter entericus TaxID=2989714 RepID=A0ABT3NFM3_9GAMM|nr:hypothetical protein [Acinetobacter entericus]MCW8038360.1 hypothetical protein [Acinetobacter entericus]
MNSLITKYYQEFESYHAVWKFKNKIFLFLIISMLIFFSNSVGYFYFIKSTTKETQNIILWIMGLAEVFTFYLFHCIEKQRNEIVKAKFRKLYKNDQLSLQQIKKRWFHEILAIPNNEYINLIEKIEKYYFIQSKYEGRGISREKIYNFIFSIDSKNRVLAMFMGLVALFTAMMISAGINVDYIFAIFQLIHIVESLVIIFIISLFLFGLFYITKYTFFMAISFFDFIFDNSFNKGNVSNRKKDLFINQLLQFAEFPKHKKRVYASLQVSKK